VCPPKDGEDFQLIADDYQKFILPGKLEPFKFDKTMFTF
jgi:hypothetical protein